MSSRYIFRAYAGEHLLDTSMDSFEEDYLNKDIFDHILDLQKKVNVSGFLYEFLTNEYYDNKDHNRGDKIILLDLFQMKLMLDIHDPRFINREDSGLVTLFYVEHQPLTYIKSKMIYNQEITETKRVWYIKRKHDVYPLKVDNEDTGPFYYADGSGGDELIESEEMKALFLFCKARELRFSTEESEVSQ